MLQRSILLSCLGLIMALALPHTAAGAEVYRWVDAQGVVHFSSVAPRDQAFERVDPGARPRPQPSLANPDVAANGDTLVQPDLDAEADPATTASRSADAPSDDELGLTEEQRERRAQLQAEAEDRRAQLQRERREQCERARRQYDELTTHSRVRVRGDDGRERLLSEEELQTRIAAARDAIVTNCD